MFMIETLSYQLQNTVNMLHPGYGHKKLIQFKEKTLYNEIVNSETFI